MTLDPNTTARVPERWKREADVRAREMAAQAALSPALLGEWPQPKTESSFQKLDKARKHFSPLASRRNTAPLPLSPPRHLDFRPVRPFKLLIARTPRA